MPTCKPDDIRTTPLKWIVGHWHWFTWWAQHAPVLELPKNTEILLRPCLVAPALDSLRRRREKRARSAVVVTRFLSRTYCSIFWIVSARGPSLTKESEGVSWISGLVSSLANGCYLCHDCTLYIYYSFKCIKIEYHHLSLLFAIACSSYNTAFVLISHAPSKDIYIVAVLIRSHPSNDIHFLVVQLLSPSAALTRCWMLIPTMTCEVRVVRFLFMSASSSHPPPVQYLHEVFNSMLVELTPLLWKWPTLETSDMWFLNKVASLVANADVKGFWERRIQLKVRLKMRRNPG